MARITEIRAAKEHAQAAIAQSNAARSSGDHIGDLCWWDAVPGWSASVAEVQRVFAKHGLDPIADLPESPDWPCAFGRAITRTRTELNGRDFRLTDVFGNVVEGLVS